ncbi:MAG: hypothetical protein ACI8P0_002467 [Planctomycetaceae bacterium]
MLDGPGNEIRTDRYLVSGILTVSAIATNLRPHTKAATLTQPVEPSEPTVREHGLKTTASACAVSMVFHACLLTACGLIWYALPRPEIGLPGIDSLMATSESDDSADGELQFEESLTLAEVTPPLATGGQSMAEYQSPLTNPEDSLMPTGEQSLLSASAIGSPWQNANVSGATTPVGSASGSRDGLGYGDGIGDSEGSDAADSFFGLRPIGRRIVYVLDCSRSMNHPHDTEAKTRFKRMKLELIKSVQGMGPESEFFLIFFNDFAIPMPSPVPVQAAEQPKLKYLYWMKDLKADGNTEPRLALRHALRLQPDIVYFLTDGSFTYRVQQDLLSLPSSKTEIHTFAFDAPFTDNMRRAYNRLLDDDRTGARETAGSRSDYRKLVEAFSSHNFMKQMAKRHGGRFRLIPYDG